MLLCVACVLVTWSKTVGSAGWHVLHPQSRDSGGTDSYPSIRYGHSLAVFNGTLVTTHGYYYDRERTNATWLSDTWALDIASSPGQPKWERMCDHFPQPEAHRHYSSGREPPAPCGRFGFASAVIGDALLLYGGNDGGYSRTNRQDYRPGHDFDELWRFNLTTRTWRLLRAQPYGGGPGKRYLAAGAAVHGNFIVYGGTVAGQGDVWSYNVADNRWTQLAAELPRRAGGPGRRMAASLTPWAAAAAPAAAAGGGSTPAGVVLFGGRTERPNGTTIVQRDTWFFDLAERAWRKLLPTATGGAAPSPPARLYHAAMDTTLTLPEPAAAAAAGDTGPIPSAAAAAAGEADQLSPEVGPSPARTLRLGIVAGGTFTAPALNCARDAWAFTLDCAARRIAWARLPDLPAAVYDTRGAAAGAAAILFGGHLCSLERPDGSAPYPYYYVNEVLRLRLDEQSAVLAALLKGGGGACRSGDGAAGVAATKEEL
ncbi:hypothetical protein GPECTOR_15g497 [Gonium pectorale]|uniref:Uncharacterized protein n=1 Tax=Gonium pectorale TaxID=33097 RepID=A0A150GLZ5_GONPE|nr:hypothetical protein GPECTOR_15g497 [Gonium pectorale]|eukprot:KXZ50811.1 hypothetical protein GPECTOR_15g497 [Gonium pectorale]